MLLSELHDASINRHNAADAPRRHSKETYEENAALIDIEASHQDSDGVGGK